MKEKANKKKWLKIRNKRDNDKFRNLDVNRTPDQCKKQALKKI